MARGFFGEIGYFFSEVGKEMAHQVAFAGRGRKKKKKGGGGRRNNIVIHYYLPRSKLDRGINDPRRKD